jgi:ketosteroid isomerase-like protein
MRMSADDDQVLAANAAFYAAFRSRDVEAMQAVWARRDDVVCIHPGWQRLCGRATVMESWRSILTGGGAPAIVCSRETVHRISADAAFVVCVEILPGGELVATNVFVREQGQWRMMHHQAGPMSFGVDSDDEGPPPDLLN